MAKGEKDDPTRGMTVLGWTEAYRVTDSGAPVRSTPEPEPEPKPEPEPEPEVVANEDGEND